VGGDLGMRLQRNEKKKVAIKKTETKEKLALKIVVPSIFILSGKVYLPINTHRVVNCSFFVTFCPLNGIIRNNQRRQNDFKKKKSLG
jgi:hypothetical protein